VAGEGGFRDIQCGEAIERGEIEFADGLLTRRCAPTSPRKRGEVTKRDLRMQKSCLTCRNRLIFASCPLQ
jgi:hypothetical protein